MKEFDLSWVKKFGVNPYRGKASTRVNEMLTRHRFAPDEVVSIGLRLLRVRRGYKPPFVPLKTRIIDSWESGQDDRETEAVIGLFVGGREIELETGLGNGPVKALDSALRKALSRDYPGIVSLELRHYHVDDVGNGYRRKLGAGKVVKVRIEWQQGDLSWVTSAQSDNVLHASWKALFDAFEFSVLQGLLKK